MVQDVVQSLVNLKSGAFRPPFSFTVLTRARRVSRLGGRSLRKGLCPGAKNLAFVWHSGDETTWRKWEVGRSKLPQLQIGMFVSKAS